MLNLHNFWLVLNAVCESFKAGRHPNFKLSISFLASLVEFLNEEKSSLLKLEE